MCRKLHKYFRVGRKERGKKKMKGRKNIQVIGFFLCLLLGNLLYVPQSYAAVAPIEVKIPVRIYGEGDDFPEEEFVVELGPVVSGSNLVPNPK